MNITPLKNHQVESTPFLIATEPLVFSVNKTTIEETDDQSPTSPKAGRVTDIHSVISPKRTWNKPTYSLSKLKVPEKPIPLSPRPSFFSATAIPKTTVSPTASFPDILSLMQSYNVSSLFFSHLLVSLHFVLFFFSSSSLVLS